MLEKPILLPLRDAAIRTWIQQARSQISERPLQWILYGLAIASLMATAAIIPLVGFLAAAPLPLLFAAARTRRAPLASIPSVALGLAMADRDRAILWTILSSVIGLAIQQIIPDLMVKHGSVDVPVILIVVIGALASVFIHLTILLASFSFLEEKALSPRETIFSFFSAALFNQSVSLMWFGGLLGSHAAVGVVAAVAALTSKSLGLAWILWIVGSAIVHAGSLACAEKLYSDYRERKPADDYDEHMY